MRSDNDPVVESCGPREVAGGRAVDLLCGEHDVGETEAFDVLVWDSSDFLQDGARNAAAVHTRSADDQRVAMGARES